MTIFLKYSCFVILFFAIYIKSIAQDSQVRNIISEQKYVIQINEYSDKSVNSDTRYFKKIQNLIFGKKPSVLVKPISLVVDRNEVIWLVDQGVKSIVKIKRGNIDIPSAIQKNTGLLQSPVGICMVSDSKFLISDSYLNSILVFDKEKKTINNFCDSLEFKQPTGIAYSKVTREIWVVETAAHRISVIDEKGNLIKRIGKRGNNPGEFNFPTFIWIDKLGTIYVVDSLNFRIQIFDSEGKLISVFGKQGDGTGNFGIAKGVAVDSFGNIYIVDSLFHAVQIFDKTGKFLYSFGSQGKERGQFWMPAGIYIDEKDNIYVADSYNARIQVFKVVNKKQEDQ